MMPSIPRCVPSALWQGILWLADRKPVLPRPVFWACCLLAVSLGQPHADALAKSTDAAYALLADVARTTAETRTLYAHFKQEKKLSILDAPLTSSGHLCLERNTTGHAVNERVIWAYETPAPSGFAYENGQGFLWTGDGGDKRLAQGVKATAIKAVTEHILAWVRVRPDALDLLYRMERLPDQEGCPALRLIPRLQNSFFAALEATFAPDLRTVRGLRFEESSGDSVRLRFSDVRVNAELPPVCRTARP